MGRASRFSASAGDAPGMAEITSIIGTEICGSSSRGVAMSPSTPTASDANVTRGVSLLLRNAFATRPEMPQDLMLVMRPPWSASLPPFRESR